MAKSYKTPFNGFKTTTRILVGRRYVTITRARAIAGNIVARDAKDAANDRLDRLRRVLE
jgi:hypothetical protein